VTLFSFSEPPAVGQQKRPRGANQAARLRCLRTGFQTAGVRRRTTTTVGKRNGQPTSPRPRVRLSVLSFKRRASLRRR